MLWLAGALAVVGIGYFIPTRPEVSLALGVLVCLFGMTLMDSAIIPLLLVVPILVSYRVALGGVDLTFSDAALFFAFFPAAIFAQRPYTPAMRSLIWCGVTYEVLTLFTVIANPYRANAIEWVHAGLLTVGALVVGWSIGREGHARLGLTLILLDVLGPRGLGHRPGPHAVRRRRLQRRLPALALRHAQERRRVASSASPPPSRTPDRPG